MFQALLAQQVEIGCPVAIDKENVLPVIAALGLWGRPGMTIRVCRGMRDSIEKAAPKINK
ncbi:MAG: hypothetical protein SGI88_13390 [Candidatus Hydrogenedentes bacterium]|nr:hypothetical protein [Candidatus Hydrogenedentota bacterium]